MAKILFVVWLVLFIGAFVIFALTPSKDFGFTAGANRVSVFFSWQIAAGLVGILFGKFPPQENTETEHRPITSQPTEIIPENR